MRPIRVLVVDDAVVIRRMLTDLLSADPELEVVGTAANGQIALTKVEQLKPDLITLDIEMPEMDGLQALAALRKTHPFLPVIMFSTLTERGAAKTLEALTLGANDYITKPANVGGVTDAIQRIRQELIPRIKAFCGKGAGIEMRPCATVRPPEFLPKVPVLSPPKIVAIGVSTGGPNTLAAIVPAFPADFPVPIVVVQHMPPIFTRILAERLDGCSEIQVREGCSGERVRPGVAWIAPGGLHMVVERHSDGIWLRTQQEPPENSCRPAVDVLFRSVVRTYGSGVLGVILTGMGHDGLEGCKEIRKAGGQVLAQDETTSVVWGMPGAVAQSGLADKILPQDQVGIEIVRRVMEGRNPSAGASAERGNLTCRTAL